MLQKLYQGLVQDGSYTKSFEEFQTQMQDANYRANLYNGLVEDGDFTQSQEVFENTYGPGKSTSSASTVVEQDKQSVQNTESELESISSEFQKKSQELENNKVDSEFWNNANVDRKSYRQEGGTWYYTNPETKEKIAVDPSDPNVAQIIKEESAFEDESLRLQNKYDRDIYKSKNKREDLMLDGVQLYPDSYLIANGEAYSMEEVQALGGPIGFQQSLGMTILEFAESTKKVREFLKGKDLGEEKQTSDGKVKSEAATEQVINVANKEIETEKTFEERLANGAKNMPKVTESVVSKDDDNAIDDFYEKYARFGFKFSVDRTNGDRVTIISQVDLDGDGMPDRKTFKVDKGWPFDFGNEEQAKKIDAWMRGRAVEYDSATEGLMSNVQLTTEEEEQVRADGTNHLANGILARTKYNDFIEYYKNELDREIRYGKAEFRLKADFSKDEYEKWLDKTGPQYNDIARSFGFKNGRQMLETVTYKNKVTYKYDTVSKRTEEEINDKGEISYVQTPRGRVQKGGSMSQAGIEGVYGSMNRFIANEYGQDEKNIASAQDSIALDRLNSELGTNFPQVPAKHLERFKQLQAEVQSEWNALVEEGDMDALRNSEVGKRAGKLNAEQFVSDHYLRDIKEIVEGMGGEAFTKSDAQKFLTKDFNIRKRKLDKSVDQFEAQNAVVQATLDEISGDAVFEDGKLVNVGTKGLHYEAKWIEDNAQNYIDRINELANGTYTTQEEIEAANKEITELYTEYSTRLDSYKRLATKQSVAYRAASKLAAEAPDLIKDQKDLTRITTLLEKNYQVGTQASVSLLNGAIDLVQNIANYAQAASYALNPFGYLGDYLIDSGKITDPTLQSFIKAGQIVTGSYDASITFDDDPNTESGNQWIMGKIDEFQDYLADQVEQPPAFKDIKSFSDFGEWAAVSLSGQIPQLALLYATAGQSTWMSTALLTASSGGGQLAEMQEKKKLFEETGGLYGVNYGFGQMFVSSTAVGLVESASEQITLGQIRNAKAMLKYPGAKEGFSKYVRRSLFSEKGLLRLGVDMNNEGLSEVGATIGQNYINYLNGEDVGLFDNVGESYVSGGLMSLMINATPGLFNAARQPFTSPSTQSQIDAAQDQIDDILAEVNMNEPSEAQTKRLEQLYKLQNDLVSKSVKTVDIIENSDKRALLDINQNNRRLKKQFAEVDADQTLNEQQKLDKKQKIDQEFQENNKQKQEILDKYDTRTAEEVYQAKMDYARNFAQMVNNMGGVQLNVNEASIETMQEQVREEQGFTESMSIIEEKNSTAAGYVDALTTIIEDPSTPQDVREDAIQEREFYEKAEQASTDVINLIQDQATSTYGSMVPVFDADGNLSELNITVNKEAALTDGMLNTASHELVHAIMFNTLQADPEMRARLGDHLGGILNTGMQNGSIEFAPGKAKVFNNRLNNYNVNQQGEEAFAIASEMMADGDMTMNDGMLNQFKGVIRRFTQEVMGRDIEFNETEDIANFIRDFNNSVQKNKPSKAMARLLARGANGKIFKDARTPKERGLLKSHSRAVISNLQSNPDLKQTFDKFTQNEDGSSKHESQEDFEASEDYWNAYFAIVEGRSLDALIQEGMTGRGLPPAALREFTRKVKEKIGERFLPTVDKKTGEVKPNSGYRVSNNSLFGWLTGVAGGGGKSVIYRAKGDVMNEYLESGEATTVSLDKKTTDDGASLADVVEAGQDVLLQNLETENLAPGRRADAQEAVTEGSIVKDVLNFSQNTKDAISSVVSEADIDINGLTYKGIKGMLVEAQKITRTDKQGNVIIDKKTGAPKLFNPTKEADVTPTGPLFEILNSVASEFGVDPLRILANQDLDSKQRQAAQEFILDQVTNQDGTYNDTMYQLLPEGETRSGEATGVANTVLGDFYLTGDRVRVSEGATKELGQKLEQKKRDDVGREEFLAMFGINPDGTFQKGKANDGAIRALVVQLAQLTANQEVRINSLASGTNSDAVRASLADGKSLAAFSRGFTNQQAQDLFVEKYPDVVDNISGLVTESGAVSEAQLRGAILRAFEGTALLERNNKDQLKHAKKINDIVNKVKDKIDSYVLAVDNGDYKSTFSEFAAAEFQLEYDANNMLSLQAAYGLEQNPGAAFSNKNDIEAVRKIHAESIDIQTLDKNGNVRKDVDVVEVVRRTLIFGLNSFPGSGRVGDGTFAPERLGDVAVKETGIKGTQRYKSVASVEDAIALLQNSAIFENAPDGKGIIPMEGKGSQGNYQVWNGTEYVVTNVTVPSETTDAVLRDQDGQTREDVSNEARLYAKEILEEGYARVERGEMTIDAFVAMQMNLGAGMQSALRKAAPATAIPDDASLEAITAWGLKNGFLTMSKTGNVEGYNQLFAYEHSTSKAVINKRIADSLVNNNGKIDIDEVFRDYEVFVIPHLWDVAQTNADYKTLEAAHGRYRLTDAKTIAEFVKLLKAEYSQGDIEVLANAITFKSIKPQPDIELENIAKRASDYVKRRVTESDSDVLLSAQQTLPLLAAASKGPRQSRGASIFDFDETIIDKGENEILATHPETGETEVVSSENWPLRGPELAKQGFEFDFSDFINVKGGVEGPLFQKLKNRITKYGNKNNYILTARPQASAIAIHGWLKSKGIDLPLENITGLGNSTGEAKAMWIAQKYSEGYNDMYFVDDALPNVEAVADIMDQLDIKGKAEQARRDFGNEVASKSTKIFGEGSADFLDLDANQDLDLDIILEQTKGVDRNKKFSKAKAKQRGKNKGRFKFFLPPSAEDFKGLLYPLMGKGKQGEAHHQYFKEKLFDPYAKGIRAFHNLKQTVANDLKSLKKLHPDIKKALRKDIPGLEFNADQAVRAYIYNKNGIDIPGLSKSDQAALIRHVEANPDLKAFADATNEIYVKAGGVQEVTNTSEWLADTISSDLNNSTAAARDAFLMEFNDNADQIFSEENLNKLEAVYGPKYVEALKDSLFRMKQGTNRPGGESRLVKGFTDWVNGSIGATMFFNARSAVLQTLSTVNFINWSDNNPLKAGKAVLNVKQYSTDFVTLFNSDFLKQRRSGLQQDLNANEMIESIKGAKNPTRAAIGYLLQKGFLPTQIADSFAIASGGATFYRNRINTYLEQGMTQAEAEAQAFQDFQEIAEETQQSSRPDKISQQQASPLGRLILAFQNTPMQYNRLMKRSIQDLVNRRGDAKTHISKIAYYGGVQNAIFYSLQQALYALAFDDEEEEEELPKWAKSRYRTGIKEGKIDPAEHPTVQDWYKDTQRNEAYGRVANGMVDSILRGSGFAGAAVSTLKNMVLEFMDQEERREPDHAYTVLEMLNMSPPIGIKARKLYSATQTWEFNQDVIQHMSKTNLDNPVYEASFNAIESITNIPLARAYSKIRNIREAFNSDNEAYQRIALLLGWSTWNFGIKNQAVIGAEKEIKEIKAQEREQKKIQKEKEKEAAEEVVIQENIEKQKEEKKENKEVTCAAVNREGKRCKNKALPGKSFCTVHDKVEQGDKQVQCSHIKKDGNRCKMQTKNKSGLCYYHD